ncbi:MAG: riboflavin synthase [Deltaproteobacteria bacterium]|nr:riboflavin synthase [Deltaproteobacteria bacterium]
MFTGIVEGIGQVREISRVGGDVRLIIQPPFPLSDSRVGDSIAVDGACLTLTELKGEMFSADVSMETLSRTTLGRLKPGDEVNLERALRLSDRLGGHLVLGHVDGVGKILERKPERRSWCLRIGIDKALSRYTIEKGSIAVDGISLTINRCQETWFEVNIIPQTGRETTLLKKTAGDPVNIETDLIGKYVEKFFKSEGASRDTSGGSGIDENMLKEFGFGE